MCQCSEDAVSTAGQEVEFVRSDVGEDPTTLTARIRILLYVVGKMLYILH